MNLQVLSSRASKRLCLGQYLAREFLVCVLSLSCVFCVSELEAGEKAAKEDAVVENATPDYAAGLVSAQVTLLSSSPLLSRRGIEYCTDAQCFCLSSSLVFISFGCRSFLFHFCFYSL